MADNFFAGAELLSVSRHTSVSSELEYLDRYKGSQRRLHSWLIGSGKVAATSNPVNQSSSWVAREKVFATSC
jgi:hypothetical protein